MIGNSALKITTLGLCEIDQQVLNVAIGLLEKEGLQCELLESQGTVAHLLIADCDVIDTQEILSKASNIPIKLLFSKKPVPGKNIVSISKPIRVLALKDILVKICKHLQKHLKRPAAVSAPKQDVQSQHTEPVAVQVPKPAAVQVPKPAAVEASTQKPDTVVNQLSLFELIFNIKQQRECARLELENGSAILVDSNNNTIANLDSTNSFKKMMKASPEEIKLVRVEPLEQVPVGTLIAIDDALWQAGISCSCGNLLTGHSLDKPVQLRAWPNFTRNSFVPCHLKLAAMLAKESLSLNQLQSMTHAPLPDIINFYNAAYGVGLIERRIRPREEKRTLIRNPTPRLKELFGQLAKRLRIA